MAVREQPLPTRTHDDVDGFVPEHGSTYVSGTSVEERSEHTALWRRRVSGVRFVEVLRQEPSEMSIRIGRRQSAVRLRSAAELSALWSEVGGRGPVYLDITGLSHHVWAPLLRAGVGSRQGRIVVVYVEPVEYRFSGRPTEGEIFDLSERITGIAPIPGFLTLAEVADEDSCFVPLLGFEGTRLAHLMEHVQPAGSKTIPIIGVPGFRPEYPFHTYLGNRTVLSQSRCWPNVRFARANCPFSLYGALEDIASRHPGDLLKIAPIGTKPHAVGAVLFALANPQRVEFIYDHPVRKARRTEGAQRLHAYEISAFLAT